MRTAPVYTPRREAIYGIVRHAPGVSVRDVARLAGVESSTADYHLRRLEKAGVLLRRRRGRALAFYLTGVSP